MPETAVKPLLDSLSKDVVLALRDISAAEAQRLISIVGVQRLNVALSLYPTGPLRGRHLDELRQRVPASALVDLLDAAKAKAGRLQRLVRIAENLDSADRALSAKTLDSQSLVLDSNARSGLDALVAGVHKGTPIKSFADLEPNYQDAINAIRASQGLGAYTDPPGGRSPTVEEVVGPNADLRLPQLAGAEAVANLGPTPSLRRMHGIRSNRADPAYDVLLAQLTSAKVGGDKGAVDRVVVADTFFAARTGGRPKFVSADQDLVLALARAFSVAPHPFTLTPGRDSHWDQLVASYAGRVFTARVVANGVPHEIDVHF